MKIKSPNLWTGVYKTSAIEIVNVNEEIQSFCSLNLEGIYTCLCIFGHRAPFSAWQGMNAESSLAILDLCVSNASTVIYMLHTCKLFFF